MAAATRDVVTTVFADMLAALPPCFCGPGDPPAVTAFLHDGAERCPNGRDRADEPAASVAA